MDFKKRVFSNWIIYCNTAEIRRQNKTEYKFQQPLYRDDLGQVFCGGENVQIAPAPLLSDFVWYFVFLFY